jgi:hypothetical protein
MIAPFFCANGNAPRLGEELKSQTGRDGGVTTMLVPPMRARRILLHPFRAALNKGVS